MRTRRECTSPNARCREHTHTALDAAVTSLPETATTGTWRTYRQLLQLIVSQVHQLEVQAVVQHTTALGRWVNVRTAHLPHEAGQGIVIVWHLAGFYDGIG